MNRKLSRATLYVPTLVDSDESRHIIPSKGKPALCGATGVQDAPREHLARNLCQRCVNAEMKQVYGFDPKKAFE